jgi:hypothetical protein
LVATSGLTFAIRFPSMNSATAARTVLCQFVSTGSPFGQLILVLALDLFGLSPGSRVCFDPEPLAVLGPAQSPSAVAAARELVTFVLAAF